MEHVIDSNVLDTNRWSYSVLRNENEAGLGLIRVPAGSPSVSDIDVGVSFSNIFDEVEDNQEGSVTSRISAIDVTNDNDNVCTDGKTYGLSQIY